MAEATGAAERSRHLDWEGCLNLRDLGGLPIDDGGTTAWGVYVRGDTLCGLSEAGRGSLIGYGIKTVVDLRSPEEITRDPNPFAQLPDVIAYLHHPLNDPAAEARISTQPSAADRYVTMIDAGGARLARIFGALATGRPGVLFHCFAGRDRTGIVAALLLRLAGVGIATIVRDYEDTDDRMRARYDEWLATLSGTARERFLSSLEEKGHPIRITIGHVEGRYGSVASYLEQHGLARADVARVRERISGGAASA